MAFDMFTQYMLCTILGIPTYSEHNINLIYNHILGKDATLL